MIRASYFVQCLSLGLCALMAAPPAALPDSIDETPAPRRLELVVVQGEGAINDLRQRVAHDTVIEVRDENGRPLRDATVSFTAPASNPTGEFSNGSGSTSIQTDASGRVILRGMKPRGSGKLPIQVSASYRGVSARTVVTQFNMEVPGTKRKGGNGKTIAILLIAAGAAAGGVVAASQRSKNTTPSAPVAPPPIGIAAGSGSVTGPR